MSYATTTGELLDAVMAHASTALTRPVDTVELAGLLQLLPRLGEETLRQRRRRSRPRRRSPTRAPLPAPRRPAPRSPRSSLRSSMPLGFVSFAPCPAPTPPASHSIRLVVYQAHCRE